jgi:hypothetical protein
MNIYELFVDVFPENYNCYCDLLMLLICKFFQRTLENHIENMRIQKFMKSAILGTCCSGKAFSDLLSNITLVTKKSSELPYCVFTRNSSGNYCAKIITAAF